MRQNQSFVLKGNILYTPQSNKLECIPNGYLVCVDGAVAGAFTSLPQQYASLPLQDYGDKLLLPGLVDTHMHAPQYAFHGTAMDKELLDWLNSQTFPEESKYKDLAYAANAYSIFVEELKSGATTRAGIYATMHGPATLLLMDMLEEAGLCTFVGKVSMNRNSPPYLCEDSAAAALENIRFWLQQCKEKEYKRTSPILTPRFIPSCCDELLQGIAQIQQQTGLPVQSHLSENPSEVEWVQELCPQSSSYADAYHRFGLFGGNGNTAVMGHCVYVNKDEMEMMRKNGVIVAHCPVSNSHLSSGIAPIRKFLNQDILVGLGTDVAGGFSPSVFRAMVEAIQVSKLRWRLVDNTEKPLSATEAFYLGTKGGGVMFGKVGSFEEGYEFDALVVDDASLPSPYEMSLEERLERVIYLSDNSNIAAKYVRGMQVK